ncbi:pentatricopeptide repeat-containing protein At2g15980 [Silene latifolia]|uniref:pentatricopeptide repeat-containing protein At2g15980 n=1 Tax=Silene latifolia TaxID=37657 RepID=UPI003D771D89
MLRRAFSTTGASNESAVTTAVSILKHQRSKSRWSTLVSLFPHGISPPHVSQIILHFRNNPHLALRFFLFTSHRFPTLPPSLSSYATIIHILARARQKTRAQSLIKDALRRHHSQASQLFNLLVENYRKCDSAPFVFDLFIVSLLEMNQFDSCLRIVRILISRGNHLNVATCNVLISNASQRKGCFFGYDLYKQVFHDPATCTVLPNIHTFNNLMLSFHKNGVLDMVEEVWIEMAKWNCQPNCYSYCILMEAYCEDADIDKAEKVWEELRFKGLDPDVVAYNTLIAGYCKAGKVDKGEELYKQMGLTAVEPTCLTYQHLVNGYCLAGDADAAMLLSKDMRRKGYCPDSSTVNAMVTVLCDKGCVMEALGFFTTVMDNADFVAKETSYEMLLKGLCGVGKMEEALKLQAQMVGKGFRPNADVYGAFIDGYIEQGKPDVAESLRKELLGIQPTGVETELPAK